MCIDLFLAFDRDKLQRDLMVPIMSKYDGIITSSQYSYSWLTKYIEQYFHRCRSLQLMIPDIHVIAPPIPLLPRVKEAPHFSALNNSVSIAFYGDFFPGTNNNGHDVAIALFQRLSKEFANVHLKLYIMGMKTAVEGVDAYVEQIRAAVEASKLHIILMVDPALKTITTAVSESLVLWDMGGIHATDRSDPTVGAVIDTYVVQAMSAGTIVIVQNHGVTPEIVKHLKHGYHATTVDDYYTLTTKALHAAHSDLDWMRNNAADRAAYFNPVRFVERGKELFGKSLALESFHEFVAKNLFTVRKLVLDVAPAGTTKQMAIIFITDFATSYEFVIRNAAKHLGNSWELGVYLSEETYAFYKRSLEDIVNIQFFMLPKHMDSDIKATNVLLLSLQFWEELKVENIFIFDSESLITHAMPDNVVGVYDFIGAPKLIPALRKSPQYTTFASGCSVRSVGKMKAILAGKKPEVGQTEAAFFLTYLLWAPLEFNGKVPTAQVASDFSIREGYPGLKSYVTPFCLNNPWSFISKHKLVDINRWMEQSQEF